MKTENRKEEIIRVAGFLFKEKGYSAVSMRDIANELGIKAASLYNHIKSKQEILANIMMSLAEDFTSGMQLIVEDNSSTIEKLQAIIALHVNITTNNPNGMAALNADWMHLEEDLDRYFLLRKEYEENFKAILLQGVSDKEIADVNVETMMFSILSTLRSLYLWIPKKDKIDPEALISDLGKVLLRGITN
ncbi:TetR/AcrR family transcriptional regulator [Pseudofulvibacter geojedonensis]|uniref:TetR/AcrR family transcriptional regulator n=1 Tax=Pseudofulvibacter geojedonensis TaxID=1123758 RepID=A0ABW3I165_9FLAO